ncbi:MAG TPA: S4 domain-containing protein, partial [Steroidobacteraceae bacterium]|nr:S4 domain-containing protein [Steroidobacteraceae bacterium]
MTEEEGRRAVPVRHVEVGEDHAGERLDNFLARLLASVPRSRIYRLVRRGEVRVNGRRARPEQRLESTDSIRVPPVRLETEPAGTKRVPLHLLKQVEQAIAHEDERLIVLDKPAGIAVHG